MKKKTLKGFTLVELVIVMAVFSILMLGVMSLVDPVSKIHKHSNDLEKTYSYVDNIQNYIQDSLEYSDNLWVYQGPALTQDSLRDVSYEFMKAYYSDILAAANETSVRNADCKIRVMTLLNSDTIIGSQTFEKGQIVMQDITFNSDWVGKSSGGGWYFNGGTKVTGSISPAEIQVNPQFFNDKFSYDYILGGGNLTKLDSDTVTVDVMQPANFDNARSNLDYTGLQVGIVVYDTTDNRDGTPKVTDVDDGSGRIYRNYDVSTQYLIANIPLMNIIARENQINSSYYVYERDGSNNIDTTKVVAYPGTWYGADAHPYTNHYSFEFEMNDVVVNNVPALYGNEKPSMNVDDNIYIIYALPDEVAVYPN